MAEEKVQKIKVQSDYLSDSESSEDEVHPHLCTSQEERVYGTIKGSAQATHTVLSHTTVQCNPMVERGPAQDTHTVLSHTTVQCNPMVERGQAADKTTQTKKKEKTL